MKKTIKKNREIEMRKITRRERENSRLKKKRKKIGDRGGWDKEGN